MEKEKMFSFRVDEALKKTFIETCKRKDIPAAQLMRDWMRQYIRDNKQQNIDFGGKHGRKNR